MKKISIVLATMLVAVFALSLETSLPAQTGSESVESDRAEKPIPEAALLTERGRQLANELRLLRRTRSTLGSKHPTLPLVEKQIAAVEEQLEAWEPAFGKPPANPFHPEAEAMPQMNEYDLRQIVIRLSRQVEQLEKRVEQLERARG